MITEDYVSFETAKLLKEKGMNKSCFNHYVQKNNNDGTSEAVTVCTLQMAMKWLREVHHIHVCPEYKTFFQERPKKIYRRWCNKIIGIGRCFRQGIQDLNELDSEYFYHCGCKTYHDTFEEACEASVKYCLKNLI